MLASDEPLKVGVVSLVILSVVELPVSLAASRSGVDGAVRPVVSMMMLKPAEAAPLLPAASVALAVMLCVPSASGPPVKLQLPVALAVVVPNEIVPARKSCTMLLA